MPVRATGLKYKMIDNYVYFYHTKTLLLVPSYCDTINDSIKVNNSPQAILSRTAPIYSYSDSGPRSISFKFNLHRDMMNDINPNSSYNVDLGTHHDIVDKFITEIQAAALPSYSTASKMVNPPIVAVRLGSDIFIKGVVTGSVSVAYSPPIITGYDLEGNEDDTKSKYAVVDVSFSVDEIDPYDAESVMLAGSFRGYSNSSYSNSLARKTYSTVSPTIQYSGLSRMANS